MAAKAAPGLQPAAKAQSSGCGWVLWGCGALIVVAIIGGIVTSLDPNKDLGGDTYVVCERLIRAKLLSPSTANFDWDVNRSKTGPWIVTGTVDAQNGFGAMIRNSFQCTGTLDGETLRTRLDSLG